MLQPTIYIPSRLTRLLSALEPAPESTRQQEPCCWQRISFPPVAGSLCSVGAPA